MKRRTFGEFPTETPSTYPTKEMNELFHAILQLKNEKEAEAFFRDLLTMAEVTEFANRWQMVKMLTEGYPYTAIAEKLKTSTATVTRVAHWFYNGMGGYSTIADRVFVNKTKKSSPPFKLRGKYTLLKNPYRM
jgi:TrpR-related protein YerC/YecD